MPNIGQAIRIPTPGGNELHDVAVASKKGEAGDAEKNTAISKMVGDYKKSGASDEQCEKLTQALQNSGTSGHFKMEDRDTIRDGVEKINEFKNPGGKELHDIAAASREGEAGDSKKNEAISKMAQDFRDSGASDKECDDLTKALQNSGTTGHFKMEDFKTIEGAKEKINHHHDDEI